MLRLYDCTEHEQGLEPGCCCHAGALTGTHCSVVPHWFGWNFLRTLLHSQVPPALTAFFSSHRCQPHTTVSPCPLLISLLLCIDVFPYMSLVLLISHFGNFLLGSSNQYKYLGVSLLTACLLATQCSS